MRRVALVLVGAAVLALPACDSDSSGGSGATTTAATLPATTIPSTDAPATTSPATTAAPTLDLAAAAAGAQAAIDLGDSLGDCPWDPAAVAAAVAPVAPLVPEFDGPIENNGQVFSGGEVDITYCEILPDSGDTAATDGIDEFRIDVHPGTADLQIYLDEEWGGQASDAVESELLGGTVSSWCLDDDQCIAAWQGDGLFVAVVTMGVATATAADAVAALEAALPVVVAGLAA